MLLISYLAIFLIVIIALVYTFEPSRRSQRRTKRYLSDSSYYQHVRDALNIFEPRAQGTGPKAGMKTGGQHVPPLDPPDYPHERTITPEELTALLDEARRITREASENA